MSYTGINKVLSKENLKDYFKEKPKVIFKSDLEKEAEYVLNLYSEDTVAGEFAKMVLKEVFKKQF